MWQLHQDACRNWVCYRLAISDSGLQIILTVIEPKCLEQIMAQLIRAQFNFASCTWHQPPIFFSLPFPYLLCLLLLKQFNKLIDHQFLAINETLKVLKWLYSKHVYSQRLPLNSSSTDILQFSFRPSHCYHQERHFQVICLSLFVYY